LVADSCDEREVEGIIGRVAGDDVNGDGTAGGKGGRGHEFELGQVGAMVLAVSALHKAVRFDGVIAIGRGGVEAALLDRDLVDLTGGVPEVGLKASPVGVVKSSEEDTEAIVGTFKGTELLFEESLENVDA